MSRVLNTTENCTDNKVVRTTTITNRLIKLMELADSRLLKNLKTILSFICRIKYKWNNYLLEI